MKKLLVLFVRVQSMYQNNVKVSNQNYINVKPKKESLLDKTK